LVALGSAESVFVFNYLGGVEVLDPRLRQPRSWCLYGWLAPRGEIEATRARLRAADVVVIPRYLGTHEAPTHPVQSPAFAEELRAFRVVADWRAYRILRRAAG
jgi:hypothetical protein